MTKTVVIINETHTLFPAQEALLPSNWERYNLPETGMTKAQAEDETYVLALSDVDIIFATPFGTMMAYMAKAGVSFRTFHNDRRNAKEVRNPDGTVRVIHTVSPEGWELVP